MSTRAESIFRNRSFSLYYAGQALSFAGDGLRIIAIPLLVYHLTGSALALGATYALELGPFALFGPIGGSLADRVDRRKLMLACDFARCAILALFAIGYATHTLQLWELYLGISLVAIFAALFVGAQASTIPYLLGKDRVTEAYSALLAAEQSTNMVIPPLGGALFAVLGPLPALAVNAFTYLCSQASLAAVDSFGPEVPDRMPSLRTFGSDFVVGFRWLFRDAALRSMSINSMFFNFFGFMCAAVYIPYLKRDFGASDHVVGYALGIGAVGAFAGSWLAARVPRTWPFGKLISAAYIADGFLFLPVMLTHSLVVLLIFNTLSYACVLFEISHIVSWRIRITPDELIGRVTGSARLIALLGVVPGALIGGALADHYGARSAVILSGLGYLALAAGLWASPALRREAR